MAGFYRPRHPERTVLYRVLFHHFDRFLTEHEARFEREYRLCSTHCFYEYGQGRRLEVTAQGPEGTATEIAEETAIELEEDPQHLDHLLNDRPEKTVLIRFAPEDCKARTPARNDSHTQSETCRNDGKAPGRGRSAPDVEDDRLPP